MRARFVEWCKRVQWSPMIHWEFGLSVDYNGEYEGSGVLIRLQWPGFIDRWAAKFLPPPEPSDRTDISEILIASLAPGVMPMGEYLKINLVSTVPTVAWAEDRLNAPER